MAGCDYIDTRGGHDHKQKTEGMRDRPPNHMLLARTQKEQQCKMHMRPPNIYEYALDNFAKFDEEAPSGCFLRPHFLCFSRSVAIHLRL